ncbi:MAG: hypothetical protein ACLFR6_08250, partial [Salinarchaeum sp.]
LWRCCPRGGSVPSPSPPPVPVQAGAAARAVRPAAVAVGQRAAQACATGLAAISDTVRRSVAVCSLHG